MHWAQWRGGSWWVLQTRGGRGGGPSWVAVSPRYTFKAKPYNFGDKYVGNYDMSS